MIGFKCDPGRLSKPVWGPSCGHRPPGGSIAAMSCVMEAVRRCRVGHYRSPDAATGTNRPAAPVAMRDIMKAIFDVLPGAISRRLRKDFPPMTTVYGWFPRLLPLRSSGKSPIRPAFRSWRGVGRSSAHPPGSTAIADWPGISRTRLSPQHPLSMPLASWS